MDYEERQSIRVRKMVISVSLPVTLIEVVDRLADSQALSLSGVFERILRRGLQIERDERAAKQQS